MNSEDLVLWRRRWSYHRSAWGAHHKTHSHKGIRVESGEEFGPRPDAGTSGDSRDLTTTRSGYDR